MIVEHGYRSYLFARALGAVERIECDDEALFAATMLHDHGFAQMESITDRCFTLVGADVAAHVLASSPLRRDVEDAITLRLQPERPGRAGRAPAPRARRDHARRAPWPGALGQLDPAGIGRVARSRHPRHGFTVRGEPMLRAHGRRVRGCRTGALFAAGFGPALKLAPRS